MLWLQQGLGKTISTLTAIVDRMRAGQVKKTLIFGPLRVVQSVWRAEARKWSHTRHLRCSVLHGPKDKRTRALFINADIYLCNYEGMSWLAETLDHYYISQGRELPFQMVVYDEVSKLKNSNTRRMKGGTIDRKDHTGKTHQVRFTGWRKLIPHFKYAMGLTGTPASNGYLDLHGQYLAVDGGERLGEYVTHYKSNYFASDYMGYNYTPTPEGKKAIEEKISDITLKMDAADYLDLPAVKVSDIEVEMPAKAQKVYAELEKELFVKLENGREIELFSRGSLSNKCLQMANGSIYPNPGSHEFEKLHDAKLDALEDVLEEAAGQPVLCSYRFKSDAKRMMKFFKKYKPVNLTDTPSRETEAVINRWNSGEIKLLIAHPACLHPATEVLTERRGWVKLIDVKTEDRVFDGVEYVTHSGCSYSGHKEVIDVFGITMTPDHKLLIGDEWVEAKDVRDTKETRDKATHPHPLDVDGVGEVSTVQRKIGDGHPECESAQPAGKRVLRNLRKRQIPSNDRHPDVEGLDGHAIPSQRLVGSQLRRAWDRVVQTVGEVRELLRGYARRVSRRFDDRTHRCEWGLLQRKLHVGYSVCPAVQQTKQPESHLQRGRDAFGRAVSTNWREQNETFYEAQPRHDCGRSGAGRQGVSLRQKSKTEERAEKKTKAHVYDLVNCGPRHRFMVRNADGQTFISHNSAGHGIDGLQKSGSILVWFGLPWSLELYDQMNARINRQGQTRTVSIIRIFAKDTVDYAVADAIERKDDTQEGLKKALHRYKLRNTVNFY